MWMELYAAATIASGSPRIGAPTEAMLDSGAQVLAMVAFEVDAALPRRSAARTAAVRSTAAELLAACEPHCRAHRTYANVAGLSVWLDRAGADALLADPRVTRIDRDLGGHGALGQAVSAANFPPVYDLGYTGDGISVVVLDSGIDTGHPDMAGKVVAESCFCQSGGAGCCPNGATFQNGPGSAADDSGHGTWVSSTLASLGVVAAPGGAPGVEIFSVKVLDQNAAFEDISDIVMAMDALAGVEAPFAVINMSLGTFMLHSGVCDTENAGAMVMVDAVDNLIEAGTLVVASSGNDSSAEAIGMPSCLSNVIGVGAITDSATNVGPSGVCPRMLDAGDVACFSNSSAQVEIMAPGVEIFTSDVGGGTTEVSGTSFATPLVAACIALMREAAPDTPAAQLRAALVASPVQVTDDRNGLTFPVLDCADAVSRVRDVDGDQVPDVDDNCPTVVNLDQADMDGDDRGDACDLCPTLMIDPPEDDVDEDGVCVDIDNCPDIANEDQQDEDADGVGDACDACPNDGDNDADGDGICGDLDPCPADPDPACDPSALDVGTGIGGTGGSTGETDGVNGMNETDEGGCGCRHTPRGLGPWWLIFAVGRRRRRAS